MNIFQKIINDKRGHAFALKHYSTKCVEDYDYFYHVRGRLRKRTTKHANGWRVRLNPKKLRRKRQTRQETALI